MSKIPTIVQMSPERGTASPFIADSRRTYPQFPAGKPGRLSVDGGKGIGGRARRASDVARGGPAPLEVEWTETLAESDSADDHDLFSQPSTVAYLEARTHMSGARANRWPRSELRRADAPHLVQNRPRPKKEARTWMSMTGCSTQTRRSAGR